MEQHLGITGGMRAGRIGQELRHQVVAGMEPVHVGIQQAFEGCPLAVNEMVEIPGGEHDPGIGEKGAGHPGNLRRQFEEAVRAPGGAARAGAATLVVRPDPDIVDADAFKCSEDLPAPFEEQLSSARLARTELDMIVPAGLLEVPVMPGGPVGAQVGRAVIVGFVG